MDNIPYIDEDIPWPSFDEGLGVAPDGSPSGVASVPEGAASVPEGVASAAPDVSTPLACLRSYWGYDAFRGIQEQIIASILAGHDTLGLMPTGGGKSITFQVPALMLEGTCLVVTPLIALMKDQVAHLKARGIKATCLHAGLSHDQLLRELDNCILGHYDFLYLSPERLHTQLFRDKLARLKVSFITVDEAHCISQWGYDFRPSYLQIKELRHVLPGTPILALTATATPDVMTDIMRQLEFGADAGVFRMSFDRPNLDYRVVETDAKVECIIQTLLMTEGSAIVYVRSRAGTRDLALALQQRGITASYYHAGLSTAEKDVRQQMWQDGRARVMVATNAFGMGIDKADVRLVLHLDPPDSIEAYFQEAGRAGRDGKPAVATLFFNRDDKMLMARRIPQTFPPKEKIRELYDDMACYFQLAVGDGLGARYEFNINDFCHRFHYFPVMVEASLRILQRAGLVEYNDEDDAKSRVMFIMNRDDLYSVRVHHPYAERVLYTLLRHYAALFSDYVYIDEAFLARECDCTEDDVYEALLGLTRLRVLHYVPRKMMPSVVYTQRRVEHDRIGLSREVYEDRLDQYAQRIAAVVRYLDDDLTPRAQQLLAYFGEEKETDSASSAATAQTSAFDGCAESASSASSASSVTPIEAVEALLADGAPHHPSEFRELPFESESINDALLCLLDKGQVTILNGHFCKK